MSDIDDALAALDRAVARLEVAVEGERSANARLGAERAAGDRQVAETTAAIVARVEAALDKIGAALEGDC